MMKPTKQQPAVSLRTMFPRDEPSTTTYNNAASTQVSSFLERKRFRACLSQGARPLVLNALSEGQEPVEKRPTPAQTILDKRFSVFAPKQQLAGAIPCSCFGAVIPAAPVACASDAETCSCEASSPRSMFGMDVHEYHRALVASSVNRRLKRARVAAEQLVNARPHKQARVVNQAVSDLERLTQAARSGNRHLARKLLARMDWKGDTTRCVETIKHVLHECLVAKAGTTVVRDVLAFYKRTGASMDMPIPACRALLSDYPSDKLSLLGDAVRHCAYDTVRVFLEAGFDPDFRMVSGCTALMVSAYMNDLRMIELLCEHGCDMSATMENGVSSLAVAAFKGNAEAVEFLVRKGAHIDAKTADGTTALMTAVQENHTQIVRILIAAGANINLCKNNGSSPIIVAVRHRRDEMIPILGSAGGDPNLTLTNGASALVLACANGDLACVNELLKINADINKPLHTGATAMEYACHRGHNEIAASLLQSLPTKLDASRIQRLIVVSGSRKNTELQIFLEQYKNAPAPLGQLHYAVFLDQVEQVHGLIKESKTNFDSALQKDLLALASPTCAAYLRRAFAPFSAQNKDLWPQAFVQVAEKAVKEHDDIMKHVFSFCGRDWF